MPLIDTYPAGLFYEAAFNATAANTVPAWWTDLTGRTTSASSITRGRQYELDTNPAGEWQTSLENKDGALDPSNTASPYWPNVLPYKPCRIRALTGVNLLTPDQATCGQGSMLPPGTSTAGGNPLYAVTGVTNDFGQTLSLVASGNAYTGSQVYQVTLPSGSVQFTTILIIPVVPIVQARTYTASAQVLITSGSSVSCNVGLVYFDRNGSQLAAGPGSPQTITAGSASWTTLSCTTQAPGLSTPATYAYLKVYINATIGSATTFQVGALQLENSATVTPWQAPQTVSRNLLPRAIATGTASISLTNDTPSNYFYNDAGSIAQASFLAAAPPGQTTALAWTTPVGTTSNAHVYVGGGQGMTSASGAGPILDTTQVTGSTAYTGSVYLTRAASADATVQVTCGFRWFDINGNLLATSSGTAVTVPTGGTWARATCTATSPAAAAWARMRIFISSPASTTATNVIYAAAWQLEQAGAATAWIDPGPTYFIYSGLFERWPQTWLMNGTYGQVTVIGVDAEAVLAQDTLHAPYVEELLALGPTFIYQFADPAGSGFVVDSAGRCPVGVVTSSAGGVGSLTLGTSITSASPPLGFIGTPGPVAGFANIPSTAVQSPMTFVALNPVATTPNYGLATGLGAGTTPFTRLLAFNAGSASPAHPMYLWSATMPTTVSPQPSEIAFFIDTSGHLNLTVTGSVTYTQTYTSASICDGNWHLATISTDNVNGYPAFSLDGAVTVPTPTASGSPLGLTRDVIGGFVQDPAPITNGGANASVALAAQFPVQLTASQISNLYSSWRTASAGESSGARAARVLNWAGWNGATALDAGSTALMGPASDLTGATALDALNAISLTENGNVYVSNSGAVTFKSRASRYNSTNPTFTFGENTAVGEWPYESIALDFDPTHLFNDVQVSQYSTSQVAEAISVVSEAAYYERVLQRTTNQQLYTEAQDAANYLLQQYSSPRLRISALTLHPAAMLGLFGVCLQLEIGMRIRVMRRPPAANAIQFDGFIESISWDIEPDAGETFVHLQCSPADQSTYWTLAATRTTLASAVTAGASQATINALPDSAVNTLAASLPNAYQLTFDPGTSIAETLTIAPPLPATNAGYSTAVITFTGTFQHNHASGAVVSEVLPTGYTDPTTWDVGSVIGAGYTTFAQTASSGASTITVGKLQDARTNALSADWNVGDLLWLSPNNPSVFEGYNLLHPNISTAGEGVLPLAPGTTGTSLGVPGAAGTPTITASASAFQGSKVWQTAVGASQATPSGVLFVNKVKVAAGFNYAMSAYMRSITTGANPQIQPYIAFLDVNGNVLASQVGATVTLTGSPTAAWTRASAANFAPAGTVWAQMGLVLTGTAPSIAWNWQGDGLQVEQASAASAYQTCPQILSVTTGVPGYSTCVITLANALANNHAAGDAVCDPLPPGTTVPTAVSASARLAY